MSDDIASQLRIASQKLGIGGGTSRDGRSHEEPKRGHQPPTPPSPAQQQLQDFVRHLRSLRGTAAWTRFKVSRLVRWASQIESLASSVSTEEYATFELEWTAVTAQAGFRLYHTAPSNDLSTAAGERPFDWYRNAWSAAYPVFISWPELDAHDKELATIWLGTGATRIRATHHAEASHKDEQYEWDRTCMLSARAAEKAAAAFYRGLGHTVVDIALEQLQDCGSGRWRYADLLVDNRFIDVKNARRSYSDHERYVEHIVKQYKLDTDGDNVTVAGLLSPFAGLDALLRENTAALQKILFLGETNAPKQRQLRSCYSTEILEIDDAPNRVRFIPPWMFEYPATMYEARNAASQDLRSTFASSPGIASSTPVAWQIAAGVDVIDTPKVIAEGTWQHDFVAQLLRMRQEHFSLPDLFLTVLSHCLGMAREPASTPFGPNSYRMFLYAGAAQRDRPLGIYDPLLTIDGLIRCMQQLWNSGHAGILERYGRFKLTGLNILRGQLKRPPHSWQTLIAYCGGRVDRGHGPRCGRNPLVIGDAELCDECMYLRCPTCAYCQRRCSRCYDSAAREVVFVPKP
jgi:hypothetical protein